LSNKKIVMHMGYPEPINMKTEYTFLPNALVSAMRLDGRSRILDSHNMQKAMEHMDRDFYPNRAAYSHSQALNNLCQELDIPVYCRGELLDEVDRYKDTCIVEGKKVYPAMNVLISWLAQHYSRDTTVRAPGEKQPQAYKRIKADMKMKFQKNSSYQKGKLIGDYDRIIMERGLCERQSVEMAGEAGSLGGANEVPDNAPGKDTQLRLFSW
jgi:hypothetical protein